MEPPDSRQGPVANCFEIGNTDLYFLKCRELFDWKPLNREKKRFFNRLA